MSLFSCHSEVAARTLQLPSAGRIWQVKKMAQQQQHTLEACSSCKEETVQSRKKDAENGMSSCIARIVAGKEQLDCTSGQKSFQIIEVMDGGGFATLLRGQIKTPTSTQIAAAKIAVDMSTDHDGKLTDQQMCSYRASMRHEHHIYERLQASHGSSHGIPTVYFAGCMKKGGDPEHPSKLHFLSFMVMELLGPSVGHLSLELRTYTHDLKLLVNHGLGMLKVLRFMHKNNIVHRDVKPDNFCLPYGMSHNHPKPVDTVYVVDMGMSQQIRSHDFDWDGKDCLYMGTVDYSSVRSLCGHNPCGWDDLEGLAVSLLEMATGNVPFDLVQGDDPLTAERLQQMAAQKEQQWQKLLSSPSTPNFIKQWMRHLRSVPPKQHPIAADYKVLQDILKAALVPSTDAASSAWSSDVSLLQLQHAVAPVASSKKRPARAPSAASNLVSCMSEAATVIQSKRTKCLQQEDDDTTSMATGLVGFSQGLVASQAGEE